MGDKDPAVAPTDAEALLTALPDPVARFDADLVIRRINAPGIHLIRRYLGDDAPDPVGQPLSRLGGATTLPIETFLRRVMRQGRSETLPEVEVPFEAGGRRLTLHFEITAIPLSVPAPGVLAIGRDRTEHRVLIEQLRRERDFSSLVLNRTGALVVVLDPEGGIVEFNETCRKVTGYTLDEVRGRRVWDFLLTPEEVEPVRRVFDGLRSGQFPNQFENFWVTKDGRRRRIAWTNTAILDRAGAVVWVIGTGWDVTEDRDREERLRHNALHDPLTGLANRAFLMELLTLAAHRAKRDAGHRFGVVYLDLDGFKEVNDRHGHPFGDRVLAAVGDRLRLLIRKSDTAARVGGDEFVILADPVQGDEGLARLADRVLAGLREPLLVNGTRVALTASLGLALCDGEDDDPQALLARADEAMYRAKRSGKARSSFVPRGPRPAGEPRPPDRIPFEPPS